MGTNKNNEDVDFTKHKNIDDRTTLYKGKVGSKYCNEASSATNHRWYGQKVTHLYCVWRERSKKKKTNQRMNERKGLIAVHIYVYCFDLFIRSLSLLLALARAPISHQCSA